MRGTKTLLPIHYHTNYRYEMNKSNVTNHIAYKLSRADTINIINNTLSSKLSMRKISQILPITYQTNYQVENNKNIITNILAYKLSIRNGLVKYHQSYRKQIIMRGYFNHYYQHTIIQIIDEKKPVKYYQSHSKQIIRWSILKTLLPIH